LKRKHLVTGGAGFIGSHLVAFLLERNREVRVIDNFLTGKRENLAPFLKNIDFIEGDIRNFETCKKAVDGVEVVYHQAALPSVPRSVEDPLLTSEINVGGTLNLLVACKEKKVKKFIFASSSSVYGDDPHLPKQEGREGVPLSPYAASKWTGEKYCQVFSRTYGLATVCLRYFNIFGPRQDPHSQYAAVVPLFITRMLKGERPVIFGDGEQSRDFTYIENVVKANRLAAETEHLAGEALNIACGDRVTVNDLFERIRDLLHTDLSPVYEEPRAGDIAHSFADITTAGRILKYAPDVSFEEGLRKTILYFQGEGR
jgi:nucleoside-diphosphate-sugar epimerase